MPSCYATCSFFTARRDYKCRRFTGGVSVFEPTQFSGAPMRMKFGKWARLLGYGPTPLRGVKSAIRAERRELLLSKAFASLPNTRGLVAPIARRRFNRLSASEAWGRVETEDMFLVAEVHNATSANVRLTASCNVLNDGSHQIPRRFEAPLEFPPGYSVRAIPVPAFVPSELRGKRFSMQLAPYEHDDYPELTFGLLDIVELAGRPSADVVIGKADLGVSSPGRTSKIKCVVWDLDNTVWDGVLVEDGIEDVRLREGVVRTIMELDRRGILQSTASKNDHAYGLEALQHFALDAYFLVPQISWGPKSAAVTQIAKDLNIGLDTIAFVDDQVFERSEVLARHSSVAVYDKLSMDVLGSDERFDVEVTSEAGMRRQLYRDEEQRVAAQDASGGDYEDFLRSCNMSVRIAPLNETDVARAYELAQRTNQLNIWTSRYSHADLRALLEGGSPRRAFTVRADDRFGSYGLVGLCIFDPAQSLVLDLMFSCRIQGKLVGEAFLGWLASSHSGVLQARYRRTARNAPARALLESSGFREVQEDEGRELWDQREAFRTLEELSEVMAIEVADVD